MESPNKPLFRFNTHAYLSKTQDLDFEVKMFEPESKNNISDQILKTQSLIDQHLD